MSYVERTKEKTQYGMKEEVDKAKEMVKQVTAENDKDKASIVHRFLDRLRPWPKHNVVCAPHWKQLSDTRMFLCS
jgi:hypothetical protein